MNWKQPTPTDIRKNPNINVLDRMVFYEAWSMVRRENGIEEFKQADRFYSVELKRGQCILKVANIAKVLKIDRRRVRKSVVKLQKWYTNMYIEGKPYGLLLTFKNVDDMMEMHNNMHNSGTSKVHQVHNGGTAKESVKSVKNKKNERDQKVLGQLDLFVNKFNEILETRFKSGKPLLGNFKYWRDVYSFEEMLESLENLKQWWPDRPAPALLLRRTNQQKEPVDYIGELLNLKSKDSLSEEFGDTTLRTNADRPSQAYLDWKAKQDAKKQTK